MLDTFSSAVHIFTSEMYPHCIIGMECVDIVLCLFRFPANKNIIFCSGSEPTNEVYCLYPAVGRMFQRLQALLRVYSKS